MLARAQGRTRRRSGCRGHIRVHNQRWYLHGRPWRLNHNRRWLLSNNRRRRLNNAGRRWHWGRLRSWDKLLLLLLRMRIRTPRLPIWPRCTVRDRHRCSVRIHDSVHRDTLLMSNMLLLVNVMLVTALNRRTAFRPAARHAPPVTGHAFGTLVRRRRPIHAAVHRIPRFGQLVRRRLAQPLGRLCSIGRRNDWRRWKRWHWWSGRLCVYR